MFGLAQFFVGVIGENGFTWVDASLMQVRSPVAAAITVYPMLRRYPHRYHIN